MGLQLQDKEMIFNEFIGPLKKVAQEKENEKKKKSTNEFNQLLREMKEISTNSVWSKIKKSIHSDGRYKNSSLSSEEKEKIFSDYLKELEEEEKQKKKGRTHQKRERKRDFSSQRKPQSTRNIAKLSNSSQREDKDTRCFMDTKSEDLRYRPSFYCRGIPQDQRKPLSRVCKDSATDSMRGV